MINSEEITRIYAEMHGYYAVTRAELPVKFKHRKLMDLGKQRGQHTYSSCGRSMGMVGMKVQAIDFDPESPMQLAWLRSLIPTRFQGIDMHPLSRGIKKTGVEATEYTEADTQLLVELLRTCPSVCILALQAPWCELDEILAMKAGHYVAAGHVDLRKQEVLVHDTGNGSPWGRIKLKHLPYIWQDHLIGDKKKVVEGWMLYVPVKI